MAKKSARGPEATNGARTVAALEHQRSAFKVKFGREPGPEDPLFFDPDADEPRPLTEEQLAKGFDDMVAAVTAAGLDPSFIKAWRELGYVIGTENRHLFSEAEVRTFEAAVLRHRGEAAGPPDAGSSRDVASSPDGVGAANTDGAGTGDSGGSGERDVAEPPSLADVVQGLSDRFEGVVAATLQDQGTEPAMNVSSRLRDTIAGDATDDATDELVAAAAFAVLTGWLSGARESGVDPAPAMQWVQQRLGPDVATQVLPVSGLIGHPEAPRISVQAAAEQLGPALVPALLWLACAVAATAGDEDPHWLRQFDLRDL